MSIFNPIWMNLFLDLIGEPHVQGDSCSSVLSRTLCEPHRQRTVPSQKACVTSMKNTSRRGYFSQGDTPVNIFKKVATMYVEEIKNKQGKKVYRTVLIRQSYKKKGKVKHRTIANISRLTASQIVQIKAVLSGKGAFVSGKEKRL